MTVLVLGATGNVGPHVVEALVARGERPRVLARDPKRAAGILPEGVDIREGDPGDDDTITAAAEGAEAILLLTPHDHDMADLQLRIIRALRRTGVRIVKLSGTTKAITPDGPYTCRQHWEIEQILAGSDQPHAIVRANAFVQTVIGGIAFGAFKATGKIPNAIGSAGISFIDARDVGDVCATLLLDDSHDSETLVLTGPRAVTFGDISQAVGATVGRKVETLELTPADVKADLLERGMDPWEAGHFEEMYQLFRDGECADVSDDAERILGRKPRTAEQYIFENGDVLRG